MRHNERKLANSSPKDKIPSWVHDVINKPVAQINVGVQPFSIANQ